MTELDRIRAALRDEPVGDVEAADDPAFDAELATALDDEDWSPAMLEAIAELVEPVPLSQPAADAAVRHVMRELGAIADQLDLGSRRRQAGMSEEEAAAMLGVNAARLQRLEGPASRAWLNLQPATVSLYLARIGLSADAFVRWLAQRLGGPEQAFGYRPGMVADDPVEVADPAATERRDWFRAILAAPNPDRYPADQVVEIFGVRWMPADVERRRGRTMRHVQAAILRDLPSASNEQVVAELGSGPLELWTGQGHLIALPSARGPRYPMFQFDRAQRRIWPVVAYCNQRLQVNRDPWGAASWWITHHEWLGRSPVELVGRPTEHDRLRQAADMIGDYQG